MIIKRKHRANYAIVPNSTADDDNLAADALGVLVYLLAKPDDWAVNIANIRARFGLGRNRVYAILEELGEAGYIQRTQARNPESRFLTVEYIVFDSPEARAEADLLQNKPTTPLPQIREAVEAPAVAVISSSNGEHLGATASRNSASRKQGRLLSNKDTNPSSKGLTPPKGALEGKGQTDQPPPPEPITPTAQVWREAKAILSPKEFGCVTGWLQRVKDRPKGFETLLAIIQTARRQGTGQPVPYITAALAKEFPPPPNPSTFTRERWELAQLAAIKTSQWGDWGPRPGERGCLMPADLITPELIRATAVRRAA